MASFQEKDQYYAPQSASAPGAYDPNGVKGAQDYEILEAGLVHNVNSSGTGGGGINVATTTGGWNENEDIEKQLRLGEHW